MKKLLYIIMAVLFCCCNRKQNKPPVEEHKNIGEYIWKTYVPQSGQAATVQGELLRAIEKLADEAQRNGNINFNADCHGILISYLRKYLTDETLFDKETILQINKDLNTISIEDRPYTEDDLYDRIRNNVYDWYLKNKTPLPHTSNPKLYC